jgi:hypothetical protein
MVDFRIEEVGESSNKIVWLGKKPKMTMKNLVRLYKEVPFYSTSGKSEQCKQFGDDLKRALKNDLGSDYKVEVSIGHFGISGFVSKNDFYVYFSVEDLRDDDKGFKNVLYRTAENNEDFRGGSNRFCNLEDLVVRIKDLLEKQADYVVKEILNTRRV